ncbi:hypothetical protein HPB47_022862 [Ixodes persulcatus]|uniref:Uncharacterized protein n=1 Tax=Ixodes persulcatus TaxID=34615 RepID=A0AC60Q8Y9_IXOPE|nr:hypothetical protein HPB47_022862 [Ixodes persulcatus]
MAASRRADMAAALLESEQLENVFIECVRGSVARAGNESNWPLSALSTATMMLLLRRRHPCHEWVRYLLRSREIFGEYHHLVRDMRLDNGEDVFQYFRMTRLRQPVQACPATLKAVFRACVSLHNYHRVGDEAEMGERLHCPVGYVDSEDYLGETVKGQCRTDSSDGSALSDVGQVSSNMHAGNDKAKSADTLVKKRLLILPKGSFRIFIRSRNGRDLTTWSSFQIIEYLAEAAGVSV